MNSITVALTTMLSTQPTSVPTILSSANATTKNTLIDTSVAMDWPSNITLESRF